MKNVSPIKRLNRILDFITAIQQLPTDLYDIYENKDGGRVMPYYAGDGEHIRFLASRLSAQDNLAREVRSFIKLSYGEESEYFTRISSIVLHKPVNEKEDALLYDDANVLWRKGRRELLTLVADMYAEEMERGKLYDNNQQSLRYGSFVVIFLISMLAIWNAPKEIFSHFFNSDMLFAVRICLIAAAASFSLILLAKDKWKEFLSIGVAFIIAIVPFIKSDQAANAHKQNDSARQAIQKHSKNVQSVDTLNGRRKSILNDISK